MDVPICLIVFLGGKKGFMTNVAGRKGIPKGTRIRDGTSVQSKSSEDVSKMHNTNTLLDCEIGYALIFSQL